MPPDVPNIPDLIDALASRDEERLSPNRYQVNIRVDRDTHLALSVLAEVLSQTRSGMATMLLKSAVKQAVGSLPPSMYEDFDTELQAAEYQLDQEERDQ